MNDDDDLLAAEFALGLLADEDAEAAQARARADAVFSLRIAWWRDQLAPLANEVAVEPSPRVWTKIEHRLGANDNAPSLMRRWRAAAIAAMSIAAGLVAVIAVRPRAVPLRVPAPVVIAQAPLIATLTGDTGTAVTVSYTAETGDLVVAPGVLDPGKGDAQLWIIPEDGTPRSLGVIDSKIPRRSIVAPDHRAYLHRGATFAISREPSGGSPKPTPTGPVIATGKIISA